MKKRSLDTMEKVIKKRELMSPDVFKYVGLIAVIIPLIFGYFEYRRSVQQDKDNNFRTVVEKLSSDKKAERLAAATSLGTYLNFDDNYSAEALDILINTLSIELDYNVLNAIQGSLEKVDLSARQEIIQKLLDLERNTFTYDYPLKEWLRNAKKDLQEIKKEIKLENSLLVNRSEDTTKLNQMIFNTFFEDLKIKAETKIKVENDYNELYAHQLLLRSFIGHFLSFSITNPMKKLSFNQNSFNYRSWADFNISKSIMKNSAFSEMLFSNVDLSRSEIVATTFSYSRFSNCDFAKSEITGCNFTKIEVKDSIDFSNSTFDDVFFLGANLKNSNFKGAVGLEPIFFYEVEDLEDVQFDAEFRKELEKELILITDEEFIEYVENCKLSNLRASELIEDLSILRADQLIDTLSKLRAGELIDALS
jgi:hypothetical protein